MLMDNALVDQEVGNYDSVYALEAEMLKHEQVDIKTEHDFCNGLYARTIHVPAGTIITGAEHKEENFFVVRSGSIAIYTENGPQIFESGFMGSSPVGIKRAGYAITDVVFTTFHENKENIKDVLLIWKRLAVEDPTKSLEMVKNNALEHK